MLCLRALPKPGALTGCSAIPTPVASQSFLSMPSFAAPVARSPLRVVACGGWLHSPLHASSPQRAFSAAVPEALKPKPQLIALHQLKNNDGARKKAKRVGRGPGSGRGKTSTRGHKGQKARSGGMHGKFWFQGGQTPLHRRFPKRGGVNKHNPRTLCVCNLDKLLLWIRNGHINPEETITIKALADSNAVNRIRVKHGVKILRGKVREVPVPLNVEVSDISESAKRLIEEAGGTVKLVWFNRVTLRAHLLPHKFPILPRSNGIPPPRLRWKYEPYMDLGPVHMFKPKPRVRPTGISKAKWAKMQEKEAAKHAVADEEDADVEHQMAEQEQLEEQEEELEQGSFNAVPTDAQDNEAKPSEQ